MVEVVVEVEVEVGVEVVVEVEVVVGAVVVVALWKSVMICEIDTTEWTPVTADGRRMGEGRTPGLHLSTILDRIALTNGEKPWDHTNSGPAAVRPFVGFLFEHGLELALGFCLRATRDWIVPQPEIEIDEIISTPDAFDYHDPADPILEEYKFTWKSEAKFAQKEKFFWRWLSQIMWNLHAAGMTKCRLWVLWACGNWRPPEPRLVPYMLTFTQDELAMNRQIILNVKAQIEKEEQTKAAAMAETEAWIKRQADAGDRGEESL